MAPPQPTDDARIELELANDDITDTSQALGEIEDALNTLAVETNADHALVTIEPLTTDQREANKALREHLKAHND